jgi:hypothetical protein
MGCKEKIEYMSEQITFWDKPRVIFIEDNTDLCEDFKKDTEWPLYEIQEMGKHFIIYYKNIFYHPFKSKCKKI